MSYNLIPSNIILPDMIVNEMVNETNINLNTNSIDKISIINYKQINPNKVSICLNMIVRNESRIIKRLLQSVLPIIDTYIICDTGSTDDTPNIIKLFFDENLIPGEIITEPFKNFGYNRTFALKAARGKATYALLLDADMIFKVELSFDKQSLKSSAYQIIQKGGNLSYHNTRLIRLDIDAKCLGPTHEYYDLPPGSSNDKLDSLWIDDIGDGGSKGDKFDRDIRLLKQGIEEEPANGRYYFYLANSYFNCGRINECIPYYEKRIELGGWSEEIFYSHLNLGHAYMKIGNPEKAIFIWMNGYNTHPVRSETIYEICKYYREKGKNKIAMAFCMLGKNIPYPKSDSLFIHTDVYETGFDYELSILGYYNNYQDMHKVCCRLMNKSGQNYNNLLSNYKFYTPKLKSYLIKKISIDDSITKANINVCGTEYKMNGSNPCIFKVGNGKGKDKEDSNGSRYMLNIRFVNYFLNNNGSYHFPVDDGKIVTVNKIYDLDNELNMVGEPRVLVPESNELRYVGMEDMKPYYNFYSNSNDMNISFIGTCQNPITKNISIGYGELDLEANTSTMSYSVVNTVYNKDCEKNWVFYGDNNVIYQWNPLTIGKIVKRVEVTDENKKEELKKDNLFLEIVKQTPTSPFFQQVRGSSNGCEYVDEMWFLCHVVEYCQPREYYHFFAVFNKDTMELKRWSHLFKFDGEKIEYALGLIVEEKRIIVSYSKWDREPTVAVYDKFKIEMEMF